MNSVQDHYDRHLGPVYSWMLGGAEPAIERGAAELETIGITRSICNGGWAIDLGAGFGVHSIPLARLGFNVLAIDSCAALLGELGKRKGGLSIAMVQADLRSFPRLLTARPELVLCMGDTITHLPDEETVAEVIEGVSSALAVGGRFVMTFRDYSPPRTGEQTFMMVRGDEKRILTCFLEYTASHVKVHFGRCRLPVERLAERYLRMSRRGVVQNRPNRWLDLRLRQFLPVRTLPGIGVRRFRPNHQRGAPSSSVRKAIRFES